MGLYETRMGGVQEGFPSTTWGTILACSDLNSPQRQKNLNLLFERYWRPVYRFIRSIWKKPVEESKDLAQGFFCHVLESDFLLKSDREKGRFRHFIKAALRNYLAEVHRGTLAKKRGGGSMPFSLAGIEEYVEETVIDPGESPDEVFDRQWSSDVFDRSLLQVKDVLMTEGKADAWRVYEAYELRPNPTDQITYEEVATSLELTASQVKNRLDLVRERLHRMVLEGIRDTVSSPAEIPTEMEELFPL